MLHPPNVFTRSTRSKLPHSAVQDVTNTAKSKHGSWKYQHDSDFVLLNILDMLDKVQESGDRALGRL